MEEQGQPTDERPIGWWNFGRSYLHAAEYLAREVQEQRLDLPFHDPVSLLIGHAIELLLKSSLRLAGYEGAALKKLGHDLEVLLQTANDEGLEVTLTAKEQSHLRLLNRQFGTAPYSVRYLRTGSAQAHDDVLLIGVAKRIESSLKPAMMATLS